MLLGCFKPAAAPPHRRGEEKSIHHTSRSGILTRGEEVGRETTRGTHISPLLSPISRTYFTLRAPSPRSTCCTDCCTTVSGDWDSRSRPRICAKASVSGFHPMFIEPVRESGSTRDRGPCLTFPSTLI